MIDRFRGEESSNSGNVTMGLRLAKSPSSLRILSNPASGLVLAFGSSHFGPPTAPSKTASDRLHASVVCSGRGSPH